MSSFCNIGPKGQPRNPESEKSSLWKGMEALKKREIQQVSCAESTLPRVPCERLKSLPSSLSEELRQCVVNKSSHLPSVQDYLL